MTSYDLGDGVNLEHLVYDRDGALTDATVVLTVTKPDGSTLAPAVTHLSTGRYRAATFVPDMAEHWTYRWQVSGAVTDVAYGAFDVAANRRDLYIDLESVKVAIGKTNADRDDLIEQAIRAASRQIDRRTGRRFYADDTATARLFPITGQSYYEAGEQAILVDDIASLDGLVVESGSPGAWTAITTYGTGPDNALAYGRPVTRLYASYGWLPAYGRIQVTARWGWPAVPDEIAQAALLLASRLYRRKDSPQGVMGNAEWGGLRVARTDPDVEALIGPFVIHSVA